MQCRVTDVTLLRSAVLSCAGGADGSKLLLGGSTLTLWDLETQQRISRLTGHPVGCWARHGRPA
jgi:hypothetical protein